MSKFASQQITAELVDFIKAMVTHLICGKDFGDAGTEKHFDMWEKQLLVMLEPTGKRNDNFERFAFFVHGWKQWLRSEDLPLPM